MSYLLSLILSPTAGIKKILRKKWARSDTGKVTPFRWSIRTKRSWMIEPLRRTDCYASLTKGTCTSSLDEELYQRESPVRTSDTFGREITSWSVFSKEVISASFGLDFVFGISFVVGCFSSFLFYFSTKRKMVTRKKDMIDFTATSVSSISRPSLHSLSKAYSTSFEA